MTEPMSAHPGISYRCSGVNARLILVLACWIGRIFHFSEDQLEREAVCLGNPSLPRGLCSNRLDFHRTHLQRIKGDVRHLVAKGSNITSQGS